MGMFDYIDCEYPLPDGFGVKEGYQTKSLSRTLSNYLITKDGKLFLIQDGIWQTYEINDPRRDQVFDPIWQEKFTGEIKFYGFNLIGGTKGFFATKNNEPYWARTYKAHFINGILNEIELLPELHENVGQQVSYDELIKIRREDAKNVKRKALLNKSKQRFNELAKKWKEERNPYTSNPYELCATPAYFSIIAMGEEALYHILDAMQIEPDHWFPALNAIVANDIFKSDYEPIVKEEHCGNFNKMTEDWLQWGKERNYI